ncbi:putative glutamine amidotransferase [Frankia canadensis]|uniref:Lipid II isoglutaminyl synthase (glutamine-hydrolyzing) subunit GatD n=1 Tax=Frankia canadensis TaxID=1836972 RepID=A0A2I2KXE6_9ACTN|nr:glutamine amidotransferase [Frankia canadensis]SNQ50329.1 putative glutamine amidotransferase [Frankia canadensis]SOU57619.1 putative glutamine amidotransferase [Frankia canadensis]
MRGVSATRIALIYPELLGTYGDGGNAIVLARRLRWRGLPAEVVNVPAGSPVPDGCDIYLLGGGEDAPQVLAADGIRQNRAILRAVGGGAAVLAVCAGYQVIGTSYPSGGRIHEGLGLVDIETRRSFGPPDAAPPPRAVGDIVVEPDPRLGLPTLFGYENHGGRTRRLPGAGGFPLGIVRRGVGDGSAAGGGEAGGRADDHGGAPGTDGIVDGRVIGTYLHGPVLAQNPALADLLLGFVHGSALRPLDGPPETVALREARHRALVTP